MPDGGALLHEDAHEPPGALRADAHLGAGVGDDAPLGGDSRGGRRLARRPPRTEPPASGTTPAPAGPCPPPPPAPRGRTRTPSSSSSPYRSLRPAVLTRPPRPRRPAPAGRPGSPPRGRRCAAPSGRGSRSAAPCRSALREVAEEVQHLRARRRVEVRGRLVGQQHRRRAGERPRDRHALLLAARRGRAGGSRSRSPRPTRSSTRFASSCAFAAADPAHVERVLDVLERGEGGEEVVLLEDEADRPAAHLPQRALVRAVHRVRRRPRARPTVGVRMQPMIERSVVLPEPEGPSRATTSPAATSIVIPFRTSTRWRPSSKTLVTSSTASTFAVMADLTCGRRGRGRCPPPAGS